MNSRVEHACSRYSKKTERGSALLIVFLFAAIVAIMLYMEMPVAVFEAQRQKEQLLVDRGNEYAHAVKLYYRKFGGYPPSIDALENTNRMRFLRHKFKDPFTGKDDWRLLHAGPGGILIDSKVKPLAAAGQNGQTNSTAFGSSTTSSSFGSSTASNSFGSSSNSGFGSNTSFASNQAAIAPPEVMVAPLPQRAPAVAANGAGQPPEASDPSQNPMMPLLQPGQAQDSVNPNPNPQGSNSSGQVGGGQSGIPVAGQQGTGVAATSTDPMAATRNLLTNPNPSTAPGTVQTAGTTGTTGTTSAVRGPGVAGVASQAGGHSIKRVNDQDDYSMWEFYYDPSKDSARQLAGAQASLQGNQNQNQTQGQNQNQTSGFGTSGFGTSGFGTTGFGQSAPSVPAQPPAPQPGSTMTTASGPP